MSHLNEGVKREAAGDFEGTYKAIGCIDGHLSYASLEQGGKHQYLNITAS